MALNVRTDLTRPLVRTDLTRGLVRAAAASPAFSPADLFASGEAGAWYDPSDLSTLYQDSAGTTAVTAAGDPVGRMEDKSGNGNHATQSTDAARPVLRQDGGGRYYLDADGVDDGFALPKLGISGSQNRSMWFAAQWDNPDSDYDLFSMGDTGQDGRMTFRSDKNAEGVSGGTGLTVEPHSTYESSQLSTDLAVYAVILEGFDFSDFTLYKNTNAEAVTLTGAVNTIETDTSNGLFIRGVKGNFIGKFYGGVILGRAASSAENSDTREWLSDKAGITL